MVEAAKQQLAMLEEQENALERKIITLLGLGYGPGDFTYDSLALERTRAAIPGARLAVQNAERAYEDFRDEARRKGILPGWLR